MKIMHDSRYRQSREVIEGLVAINDEINDCQKCVSINTLRLAHLIHGLVSKAKINTKTAKTLQYVIVVSDKHDKLIIGFI